MHLFNVLAVVTSVTIGPLVVTLLSGTIIPILVGLVTKSSASAGWKQAATVVLAGVAGLIQSSVGVTGASVLSTDTLILAAASWVVAIATYHGVYQAHDINSTLSPDRGLG